MPERDFIKNLVSTSSLRIIGTAVGYAVYLQLSHFYGPEQLGRFFITLGVIAFASRMTAAGIGSGLVKFIPSIDADQGRATTNGLILKSIVPTLIIGPVTVGLLQFYAPYISITVFKDAGVSPFIRVMSLAVLADALITIVCGCFTAIGMSKTSIFGETAAFNIVFVVAMAASYFLLDNKVVYFPYIYSMCFCAIGLIGYWLYKNSVGIKKTALTYHEIFSVSFPVMFAGMTRVINSWADILMLGMYRDATEVGIYGIATKVAGLASVIAISANTVSAPKMSLLWFRGDREELQKLTRRSTMITLLLTIPAVLFLIFFSQIVLQTFGSQFAEGKLTLIILLFGCLLNVASGPLSQLMCLTILQKEYSRILFSGAIANVALNIIFIPRWGMEGAAIASVLVLIYITAVQIWLVYSRLGIKTDVISFMSPRQWR